MVRSVFCIISCEPTWTCFCWVYFNKNDKQIRRRQHLAREQCEDEVFTHPLRCSAVRQLLHHFLPRWGGIKVHPQHSSLPHFPHSVKHHTETVELRAHLCTIRGDQVAIRRFCTPGRDNDSMQEESICTKALKLLLTTLFAFEAVHLDYF